MTTFELKIIIIMAAFMVLFTAMIIHQAFATHLYTGVKFYTVNPKYCISTTFSSGLNTAIRNGVGAMNALPSAFTLSNIAYNSNCFNKLYQVSFSPNYISISTLYKLGTPPHINHVYTAYNSHYIWTGSSTCSNSFDPTRGPYNIRATTIHELGHWIEMRHPSSSTESTAMHANFDCAFWASYKSHDISTINTVWPSTTQASTFAEEEEEEEEEEQQQIDFALPNFNQQAVKKMTTLAVIGTIVKQSQGPAMDVGLFKIPQIVNTIQIDSVLKGNYKANTVQVLTPSSSNDKRIVVEDIYNNKQKGGEHGIFLLFPSENKGFYEMVGLNDGKYQISKGGMVTGKFLAKEVMNLDSFREKILGVNPNPAPVPVPVPVLPGEKIQSHDPEPNENTKSYRQFEQKEPTWKERLGFLTPPLNKTQMDNREWQQLMRIVS